MQKKNEKSKKGKLKAWFTSGYDGGLLKLSVAMAHTNTQWKREKERERDVPTKKEECQLQKHSRKLLLKN